MKFYLTSIILLLLLSSCKDKTVDDSMKTCTSDSCTVIKGRFTTANNQGIPNVTIEINVETPRAIGKTLTRKVAYGKTDSSGNYSFSFGLSSKEATGDYTKFIMSYKYDQYKYQPSNISFKLLEENLSDVSIKGVTVKNIYLPTVRKIKVNIEGYTPLQKDDFVQVITNVPFGIDKEHAGGDVITSTGNAIEKELSVSGNDTTVITLQKRKNDIYTTRDTAIYTPVAGDQIHLTFSY